VNRQARHAEVPPGATARARTAFTIVELMLVIFIISLLIGIGVPSIDRLRSSYTRSLSLATLNMIEKACETYRVDFKIHASADQPWKAYPPGGNNSLVWALTGYAGDAGDDGTPGVGDDALKLDDGCAGFGFRRSKRGWVYGPYGGTEGIRTKDKRGGVDCHRYFVDAFDNEVFYYRFEYDINEDGEIDIESARFVGGLGDDSLDPPMQEYAKNSSGDYYRRDILLCTRGPDAIWGSRDVDGTTHELPSSFSGVDDVTNFLQE